MSQSYSRYRIQSSFLEPGRSCYQVRSLHSFPFNEVVMKDEMDQKIASLSSEFNPFSAAFSGRFFVWFNSSFLGDLALLKCFYKLQLSLPEEERKDLLTLRDKDHNYAPLIYTATCKGHLDVLAWLLDLGYAHCHNAHLNSSCDANITNGNGDTPLHCAATFNQLDCCIVCCDWLVWFNCLIWVPPVVLIL